MKTMQEVQTLISDLQQFYTDVRLLDAAAIERIEEGVRSNPKAEDMCYACRHRSRRCHHCAVKSAFENHDQRTKLEYFSPDIVQVSAQYMEVDGAPYVLELLQRMQSDTIVEPDDTEVLFSALSGYNTKLYHDPLTDMYNRRYYEEIVRGMKGPIGVALMDLDDFKVYNDTYGHHAGDMALKTACAAASARPMRWCASAATSFCSSCLASRRITSKSNWRGSAKRSMTPSCPATATCGFRPASAG